MLKRIVAALCSTAMMMSVMPGAVYVSAKEADSENARFEPSAGAVVYSEDFEESDIKERILNQQYGFSFESPGQYAIDIGNGFGTGSNAMRFTNVEWGGNNHLTLDLAESAAQKGYDEFAATAEGNSVLAFKMVMDADYGGFWNGSTNTLVIEDQDGNGVLGLEAYTKDNGKDDITLNLIALNDAENENIRYELARGRDNVFKLSKDIEIYFNTENNTYQLRINGKTISAGSHGEWIPMSTSGFPGSAEKASGFKFGKMKIENRGGNWYGGIVLGAITAAPWTKLEFMGEAIAPDKAMTMWYRQPAAKWAESLPLGNGRIGANIWGGILSDTVSLSEVTVWSGEDHSDKELNKDGSTDNYAALKALREEMSKENPDRNKVSAYLEAMEGKGNPAFGTNRPFGKINFNFAPTGQPIENYRRSLDLEEAVSRVEYSSGGVNYSRTAYVSNPAQVLVMTYEADDAGRISFDTSFATEQVNGGEGAMTAVDNEYIRWDGKVYNNSDVTNGVNTFAFMKALSDSGEVTYDNDGIHVKDADSVTLIVSLGTDLTAGENYVQNTPEKALSQLNDATGDLNLLYRDHVEDVSALFNRMKVEIGPADELASSEPTDVRLEKIREGGEVDGSFMSLWYQYARYLMIAGSRENSPMPMNLLGIWNDNVAANMAWTCDYHLDINTQMNQWMANSSNLSEAELPVFKWMKDVLIPSGQDAARKIYGIDNGGWFGPISTNAWGWTGLSEGAWQAFTDTTCGAWLAQEVMSYYDHTGDKKFLEGDGWYILYTAAQFYNEFLYQYTDKNGQTQWVAIPSGSPENGELEVMTTMDMTVIMDLFTQIERCYDILGKEHDAFYDQVNDKLENIKGQFYNTGLMIKEAGNLAEWPYRPGTDDGNTSHRHTSHLLGLFPYAQITPDKSPELARAALISMRKRTDREDYENTEWTAINSAGQYARLKDSEMAYKYLKLEADTFTWPNLLSISPEGIALAPCDVYCIDGVLGTGQAFAEMVLQSHSNRLEFLPALPKQWSEGKIEGMSAEGAFDVDFTWKDYTIESASITSKTGNTVNILKNAAINWDNAAVFDSEGNTVATSGDDKLLTFATKAGETYTLMAADGVRALQTGRIINNSDSRISYNGFNYHNDRAAQNDFGGDVHYSEKAGSTAEFSFTGTGIDVLVEKDGSGKKANVYIDGVLKGEYSAYNDGYINQAVLCSIDGLEFGNHTIKIEQTEDGGYLVLDAFAVRGQWFNKINDDNPMISYEGGWGRSEGREGHKDYMGDAHYADAAGKYLTVEFNGTGIETMVEKSEVFGSITFEVDGAEYGTVNTGDLTNAPADKGQQIVMPITGLSNGAHTLKITNTGEGGWGWCVIDGFVILKDSEGVGISQGTYAISGLSSGKMLEGRNGTAALATSMSGAENQKWYFDYVDDRAFRLINAQSGMAASISSGDNRSLVQEPVDETSKKQLWQVLPYTTDNGEIQMMNCSTAQFAQIDGGYNGNGGGVALWTYENSDHTRWTLEDAGNGFVFIKNAVGTYLQVDSSSADSAGASIKTWEKLSGNDQTWNITPAENDAYKISSPVTGKLLVSSNGTPAMSDGGDALWSAELRKENGAAYYVFTNIADGTELSIEGETGWKLAPKSVSAASPAASNIKVSGAVNNGAELKVTYDYISSENREEGESTYNVYVLSSKYDKAENPVATGSAKGGFSFTLPEAFTKSSILAVEILPKTKDGTGNGRFFSYVKALNDDNTSMSVNITGEKVFDNADLDAIKNQTNGWSRVGGTLDSDYTIGVSEKDGVSNAFSLAPTDWWKEGKLLYNLDKAGIGTINGKGYVEANVMFDAPNYFDRESRMIFALNNGTTDFAAVRLMGRRLDVVAMNEDGSFRQLYTIGLGMEQVYGKWTNFKFYTDGADSFAVAMNDEFVRNQNGGIWFKAAQDACDGPYNVSAAKADKIAAVKLAFEWSGKDSSLRVADMKFGTYEASNADKWRIASIEPENGELVFGKTNNVKVTVVENEAVEDGKLWVALFKDGVLRSVKSAESLAFNLLGEAEAMIALDVPQQGGNYEIKGFVWNSRQEPIGGAYVKKINVESTFVIPNVFSDNMMLQADKPVTVWGAASAGKTVDVVLVNDATGEKVSAQAASDGKFSAELPAQPAGGSYTLTMTCGEETRTYKNVIFGDIYLLAGQSNMEYWMSGLADTNADLEANKDKANNPNIRSIDLLSKGTDGASEPQENLPEVSGTMWKPMTYGNARSVSQIGYYFAQRINEETERPVGFICAAVGGTGSDRWVTGGGLYNNRVYPVRNLELAGILYYQGEADEGKTAAQYSDIMAGIIDDYRELFGREDLPFYYAQLARYSGQNFEAIRAGQVWAADKVKNKTNIGLVSNLDEVGNKGMDGSTSGNARNDIHPYGKQEVARRFALYAERDIYGKNVTVSGPVYKSMKVSGRELQLTFDCTGSLKIMDKDQYGDYQTEKLIQEGKLDASKLNGFEIAGADGKYYEADAVIRDGNTVVLTSSKVSSPVKARFAWGAYPESPNLTDETGLPSYTFATDCTTR